MRRFLSFIALLIAAIIIAALAVFAAQNTVSRSYRFLGMGYSAEVWWMVIGGTILGFILALLLLAPGMAMSGWRRRRAERENARLRTDVDGLRAQVVRLQAARETPAAVAAAPLRDHNGNVGNAGRVATASDATVPYAAMPYAAMPAHHAAPAAAAVPERQAATPAVPHDGNDGQAAAPDVPSLDNSIQGSAGGEPVAAGNAAVPPASPGVPSLDNTATGSTGMPPGADGTDGAESVGPPAQQPPVDRARADGEVLAPWPR